MRVRSILLALTLLVATAACSTDVDTSTTSDPSSVPTSPIVTRVAINNFDFTPRDLIVQAGTTVEWRNRAEGTGHTATAVDGEWDSGTLAGGEAFEFTFSEPGTFEYFCAIHPSMTGSVTVEG